MNSKTVCMTAIGFSDHELKILQTVSLASRCGCSYHFELSTAAPQQDLAVFICNADNPEAVARWNIYRVAFPNAAVIMTSRHQQHDSPHVCLPRPLSARQILNALNRIFVGEKSPESATAYSALAGQRLTHILQRTVDGLLGHLPESEGLAA